MKKIISICLITVLTLSVIPAFSYSNGLYADTPSFYNLDNKIFTLSSYEKITAETTVYNYSNEAAHPSLITALYIDEKLSGIHVDSISVSSLGYGKIKTTEPFAIPDSCSNYSVKAFVVNDLYAIIPLCNSAEISSNTSEPQLSNLINDDFSQAPKDIPLTAENEGKCIDTFGLYAKTYGYSEGNQSSYVHEDDYITYHGNFSGGKVTAKVGNSDVFYRDTVLAYYGVSLDDVGWGRYDYLIDYFWGENFHIYAGNAPNNMKEIPFTWTGSSVAGYIYAIATTDTLPVGTAYVKVEIDNTNWINRLYYVQITGTDSTAIPTPPPGSIYNASVTLSNDIVETGVPITATTHDVINPRYSWYVGGKKIDDVTNTYIPKEEDTESFIKVVVSSDCISDISAQVYFSKLPVLYINTDDGNGVATEDYYESAKMHIQGNSLYNFNTVNLYNGNIQIKGRGNSTWGFPKKPYNIKLDEKTNLFGMSSNKHWALLANYLDESLMRNAIATDFSEKIGMNAMNSTWVNLIINGKYAGNYQLCEQIRPAKGRVDIYDWEKAAENIADAVCKAHPDTLTVDDRDSIENMLTENLGWITDGSFTYKGVNYTISDYYILPDNKNGGFLFEFSQEYDAQSQFRTTRYEPIMIEYPEYLNTNSEMFNYLENYVNAFESAVYSTDGCYLYNGKYLSYAQLADMKSMVQYWLVCQFMCNEIDYKSQFMYMGINDVLHFGPPWDFDFSSGAENPWGTLVYDAWKGGSWFAQMRQSPYFAIKAQELFYKNLNTMHSYAEGNGWIDQIENYIGSSAEANSKLWFYKRGHDADVAALKDWLNNRISWMNSQLINRGTLQASFGITTSPKVTLTATDQYGNALTADNSQYAVSDGIINSGSGVSVTINTTSTSTTKFNWYVNGIYYGYADVKNGTAHFDVPPEYLTEAAGTNNVIMVYGKNSYDSFTYMNYLTIKRQ